MMTVDLPSRSAVASRAGEHLPALRAYLARAQRAMPLPGKVSVLLTTDREIRRLNREFRGKDKATDVLSFPALVVPAHRTSKQNAFAGDLAISVETAARQAKQCGHPLLIEMKILLLHGLLHLAGHDHETDGGEMATLEETLRRRFRLPTALIARGAPAKPAARPSRSGGRA